MTHMFIETTFKVVIRKGESDFPHIDTEIPRTTLRAIWLLNKNGFIDEAVSLLASAGGIAQHAAISLMENLMNDEAYPLMS